MKMYGLNDERIVDKLSSLQVQYVEYTSAPNAARNKNDRMRNALGLGTPRHVVREVRVVVSILHLSLFHVRKHNDCLSGSEIRAQQLVPRQSDRLQRERTRILWKKK